MIVDVDGSPLREYLRQRQSHIPSPCGAASLLLPFGTCHETLNMTGDQNPFLRLGQMDKLFLYISKLTS
ncbi:hypothetical protein GQ457_03G037390 [Hibiscus cannabinus]